MSERHYLDHAATTHLRPEAREALIGALGAGNPGGRYASGRAARALLDDARERVADLLGCEPVEVVFTSGGTEADNLAVQGLYLARSGSAIVAPPVEHEAVARIAAHLAAEHWAEVLEAPVDAAGRVDPARLPELDRRGTALVACMAANNETGAIQPVAAVAERCRAAGVPLHVDAVQTAGAVLDASGAPTPFRDCGAATLALSAHKFGGPRGIGALLVRRGARLAAHVHGGGQERGLRSGTPDVAGAVGLAAALAADRAEGERRRRRLRALRDRLREGILATVDDVVVHTTEPALPGHLHLSFPGAEGDSLTMLLDAAGVECSTGSACSAGVHRPSHVLLAMGVAEDVARAAVRFTLGWDSAEADVAAVLAVVGDTVSRARAAGMA